MLYLLGLQLGGPRLAGVMNFGFAALTAAALAVLVRRLADPAAGRAAAAVFLLLPPVLLTARFGSVEILLALCFTFELWCLHRWRDGAGRGWAAAAGLFAGLVLLDKIRRRAVRAAAAPRFLRRDDQAKPRRAATSLPRPAAARCLLRSGRPALAREERRLHGEPGVSRTLRHLRRQGLERCAGAALLSDARASWAVASSLVDFLRLPADLVLNPERLGAAAASAWVWPVTLAAVGRRARQRCATASLSASA